MNRPLALLGAALVLAAFRATGAPADCAQMSQTGGAAVRISAPATGTTFERVLECADIVQSENAGRKSIQIELPATTYRLQASARIPARWKTDGIAASITGQGTRITGAVELKNWRPYAPQPADAWPKGQPVTALLEVPVDAATAAAMRAGMPRNHGEVPIQAPPELIVGGRIYALAVAPATGTYRITAVDEARGEIRANLGADAPAYPSALLQGTLNHEWADAARMVTVAPGAKGGESTLTVNGSWPKYGAKAGGTFVLMGGPSMLSRPGQYAVAPGRDVIVFWPQGTPTSVELTGVTTALAARGSARLKLAGLAFDGLRGVALELAGEQIEVLDTSVRNVGTVGIVGRGSDITIRRTTVSHTGASGVVLSGGERRTLTPGRHVFESGRIEEFGRLVWSSLPGIRIDGVGNAVLDSKITGGPHAGIFYFGNDHEIARNEVSDVARRTGDVGAIYTGRDWAGRGHKVHHNYIHDVQGVGTQGASALYLDDQSSGVELSDNVVWNVNRGVLIGGGRDNVVRRNLFLKTRVCVRFDARGLTWQKDKTAPGGEIWKKYAEVPATSELYRSRYPGVGEVLQNQPGTPVGNQIVENIGVDCEWAIDPPARAASTIDANLTAGPVPLRGGTAILSDKRAPSLDALQVDWPAALAAARKN